MSFSFWLQHCLHWHRPDLCCLICGSHGGDKKRRRKKLCSTGGNKIESQITASMSTTHVMCLTGRPISVPLIPLQPRELSQQPNYPQQTQMVPQQMVPSVPLGHQHLGHYCNSRGLQRYNCGCAIPCVQCEVCI